MSYPSVPAGGLAPPPAKHWSYKTNTSSTLPAPPGPSVAPPKPKHLPPGMPFDPAELSRRLVMVERKQFAKERARAAQAALSSRHVSSRPAEISPILRPMNGATASSNLQPDKTLPAPYHHVPSNAATQFASTTTNESIRSAELAYRVPGFGVRPLAPDENVSAIGKRAQIHSSMIPENTTPSMATLDKHAKSRSRPHTIEGSALLKGSEGRIVSNGHTRHHSASGTEGYGMTGNNKRTSKGSFEGDGKTRHSWLLLSPPLMESEALEPEPEPETERSREITQADAINEHRVDWTQSDEETKSPDVASKSSVKVKKTDSIWTLRGRLSGLGRHHDRERDSKHSGSVFSSGANHTKSGIADSPISPTATVTTTKSSRSGFFARFKRQ